MYYSMIQTHHPLSAEEVAAIAGCPINVIKYQDLDELDNIDQIFSTAGCALLLYETQVNQGHWVCLIDHPDSIIFFDSYGLEPDNQLTFTNIEFRRRNDMMCPHLTALLEESPKKIFYNDKRLQLMIPEIFTCGYWVGYRMRKRKLTTEQFNNLFKGIPRQEKDNAVITLSQKYLD